MASCADPLGLSSSGALSTGAIGRARIPSLALREKTTRLSTDMTLARGGGKFDTEATEAFRPSFEQSEEIQTEPQLETLSLGRFALLAMTSRVDWKSPR